MTTDAARPPFWDDELERLSELAIVIHGEDVVSHALARAFAQLRGDRAAVLAFAEFTAAVKAELQRLVRPH